MSAHRKNILPAVKSVLLPVITGIFLSGIISSCDPCGGSTAPDDVHVKGDIIFSAKTVNDSVPCIYTAESDGRNIHKVIDYGTLFSTPSRNDRIAYLSKDSDGETVLMRAKTDGSEKKDISPNRTIGSYVFHNLVNPVISPDGKIIIFSAGDGWLWETAYDGGLFSDISNYFCEGTFPSVSPDGNYVAFYQGQTINNALTLRVADISVQPPLPVSYKEYLFGITKYRGEPVVSWSPSGSSLCYIITNAGIEDEIYINNKQLNNEDIINSSSDGAFMPVYSPAEEDKLVFCGRDGNLYLLIYAYQPKIIKLTNTSLPEIILYPQFSPDGNKLVYTSYYDGIKEDFSGVIKIFDLEEFLRSGSRNTTVIQNNAYRAFWIHKDE